MANKKNYSALDAMDGIFADHSPFKKNNSRLARGTTPVFLIVRSINPYLLNESESVAKINMGPHFYDNVSLPYHGVIPMLNRKIVGSRPVSIREQPYVASIRRNIAHYLVGTIVTKNFVLSVAHPLIDVSIAELSVVLGENYADRGVMLYTVILLIVHEDFNQSTLEHDISLLRIYEDIIYKGSVKSITLMNVSQSLHGHQAFVTGWGRCDRTGRELCLPRSTLYTRGEKFDPMLKTVSFYMQANNSYCKTYKNKELYIGPGMLCQGSARAEDSLAQCMAVPGAPLVVKARLSGILSWGFGCSHSSALPLIYTNCQYYRSWVVNNIRIMRGIRKVYLLKLFQVKRAYVLTEWLKLTRSVNYTYKSINEHMEALKVDKKLARLSGTVYDIRDYLYGGIHHKYKINLYKKLRKDFVDNVERQAIAADIKALFIKRDKEMKPFLMDFNKTLVNGYTMLLGQPLLADNNESL